MPSKVGYFNSVIKSSDGTPAQATITVLEVGTSTLATIYADSDGASVKTNPFQTDSLGRFQFWGDAGYYDVQVSGTGITTYKIQSLSLSDVTHALQLLDMPNYVLSGVEGWLLRARAAHDGYELWGGLPTTFASGEEGKIPVVKNDLLGYDLWGGLPTSLASGDEGKVPAVKSDLSGYELVDQPSTVAGVVPVGGIVMWSGTVATIPSGWALCDGSSGTPDLRDRFVVGAKQDDGGVAKTNVSGSLTQTGGAAAHPAHADHPALTHSGAAVDAHGTDRAAYDGAGPFYVNGATHSVTQPDQHAAQAHDTPSILNPYYALAFIMRTA